MVAALFIADLGTESLIVVQVPIRSIINIHNISRIIRTSNTATYYYFCTDCGGRLHNPWLLKG